MRDDLGQAVRLECVCLPNRRLRTAVEYILLERVDFRLACRIDFEGSIERLFRKTVSLIMKVCSDNQIVDNRAFLLGRRRQPDEIRR